VIKVRYFPAAEQELLDEIAYLGSQSPGLGRRFLTEVKRVESEITQFPSAGREIATDIRKLTLQKFRYSLVYLVDETLISMLRSPMTGAGRTTGPVVLVNPTRTNSDSVTSLTVRLQSNPPQSAALPAP
jgi:hypothetical protein